MAATAAISLQYTAGPPVSRSHASDFLIRGNDYTSIADLDDSETLYTTDFTLLGQDKGLMFIVTTTGDTTAGHTAAISLMHGAAQANGVLTSGLIRAGQTPVVPATTITLDMGTAADRAVILHASPTGYDADGTNQSAVVSLRFVGAGSLSNCVVRVTAITYALRSEK